MGHAYNLSTLEVEGKRSKELPSELKTSLEHTAKLHL